MFFFLLSFACILLGVGGRVRSPLYSQKATVIVDYALRLYLSCFREKIINVIEISIDLSMPSCFGFYRLSGDTRPTGF